MEITTLSDTGLASGMRDKTFSHQFSEDESMNDNADQVQLYITERPILVARSQRRPRAVIERGFIPRGKEAIEEISGVLLTNNENRVLFPTLPLFYNLNKTGFEREGGLYLRVAEPVQNIRALSQRLFMKKRKLHAGYSLQKGEFQQELIEEGTPVYIGAVLSRITEEEWERTMAYHFKPNRVTEAKEGKIESIFPEYKARLASQQARTIQ